LHSLTCAFYLRTNGEPRPAGIYLEREWWAIRLRIGTRQIAHGLGPTGEIARKLAALRSDIDSRNRQVRNIKRRFGQTRDKLLQHGGKGGAFKWPKFAECRQVGKICTPRCIRSRTWRSFARLDPQVDCQTHSLQNRCLPVAAHRFSHGKIDAQVEEMQLNSGPR